MNSRMELINAWMQHTEEVKHDIHKAKYDMNLGGSFIACCVKGCKWEKTVEPKEEIAR